MPIEAAAYIAQLDPSNPVGALDDYSTADDHLRMMKSVLRNQFPNFGNSQVLASVAELNLLQNEAQGFGRWQRRAKTTNQTMNNTAVLANDNELRDFVLALGARYRLEAFLLQSSTVGSPGFTYNFTTTSLVQYSYLHDIRLISDNVTGDNNAVMGANMPSSGAQMYSRISLSFRAHPTIPATMTLQWSQQAATVSDTVLWEGSWVVLERLD